MVAACRSVLYSAGGRAGSHDQHGRGRFTKRALATPGVIGWDVTIYNPDLDANRVAARRIVRYVRE